MENESVKCTKPQSKIGRVLNASWKVALVIIGIFAAISIIGYAHYLCSTFWGRSSHEYDGYFSENIYVHHCLGHKVRLYDAKAEKYVTPRLKWVSEAPSRDYLAVFCDKNDKRGFINVNTGEIVIEGKFEYAWVFSEGLAAVVEPGGKMGFIDHDGNYAIEPEFDYISTHDYVFKHDVCCIGNESGYQGLINRNGEWVVPQIYSYIDYIGETDMFMLKMDEKYGLVQNCSFEEIFPVEYDDITLIGSLSEPEFILRKDNHSQRISINGEIIDSFLIDGTEDLKYMTRCRPGEYDEYEISDKVIAFFVGDLWGVLDKKTGAVIIPAKYSRIEMASKDIIECGVDRIGNSNYVLYDIKGNKIK